MTHGYKVLTHDWRPPVQGGDPLCDGMTWPVTLPAVMLDPSDADCAPGWHYCARMADALRIGGLWPSGRPSRVVLIEAANGIRRGDKSRAASLTLLREATEQEVQEGILDLSRAFGPHCDRMAAEQQLWRRALARPDRDRAAVIAGLTAALKARGLPWQSTEYADARDARDAWAAWDARAAWAAWDAWDARAAWDAWDAWDARAARAAWDAWAAWDARAAWDAWDAWAARAARDAWAARAARDAWAACAALTLLFAALQGWVPHRPDLLTTGIRGSYAAGLAIAIPTGPKTLGWAMEP